MNAWVCVRQYCFQVFLQFSRVIMFCIQVIGAKSFGQLDDTSAGRLYELALLLQAGWRRTARHNRLIFGAFQDSNLIGDNAGGSHSCGACARWVHGQRGANGRIASANAVEGR